MRLRILFIFIGVALSSWATRAAASGPVFESDVVRPLALSPDGTRLFAVNTPDARLEILRITDGGLVPEASVPVGLEPVAVAARSAGEVWVVNHLSDSVSVVDVASVPPRVIHTLWVGDEPRDIVFAGPGHSRAFITTAHRGQNSPVDPAFFAGNVGRADVWVFDTTALGGGGGTPLTVLTLFGDKPRALAATPDGSTVYAAVFKSGNLTTTLGFGSICPGGEEATCEVDGKPMPGGRLYPPVNAFLEPQPDVGIILKQDPSTGAWLDPIGRDWRNAVRFTLPDLDVFAINALATPPVAGPTWAHVGTILFNMAVNPVSGRVYVSNTEALNERRFAGPAVFTGGSSVRGRLHQSRITVLDGAAVLPRHLNKHIDYDQVPSPPGVAERSLAQPMGMAVTNDGHTLYVAALGSAAVGIFNTAELEADTFTPNAAAQIAVSGGGPTGVMLDEPRGRLYVATRFDDGVSVIDTGARTEVEHLTFHDPEPPAIVAGRPFFYDARHTSSNGEASCAVCHVFADTDALAWDLGNPDAPTLANPNPTREGVDSFVGFRPMKGPMTTQTFRNIGNQGPMHWRGDRSGALDPGGDAFDERAALRQFNEAFVSLMAREAPLPADELEQLVDFGLSIVPPPNPHKALDGSSTPVEAQGEEEFRHSTDCIHCHRIDPPNGVFGADGMSAPTDGGITFFLKIPPLHSAYQKIGMLEMRPPFNNDDDTAPLGPQVRGFGFMHDGAQGFPPSATQTKLEFIFRFPGPLAPVVGQQVLVPAFPDAIALARADLLAARAAVGECDLAVHGVEDGALRGWLRQPDGRFRPDRSAAPVVDESELRSGGERSYTCAPPGSGMRLALDRDEDGFFDGDERDAGTDPSDASSHPFVCGSAVTMDRPRVVARAGSSPNTERFTIQGVLPATFAPDPATSGFVLTARAGTDRIVLAHVLPGGAGWSRAGRRSTFTSAGPLRRVTLLHGRTRVTLRIDGEAPSALLASGASLEIAVGTDEAACATATLKCRLAPRGNRITCVAL